MANIGELRKVARDLLNRKNRSEEQLRASHDQNQVQSQTMVSHIPTFIKAMERTSNQRAV